MGRRTWWVAVCAAAVLVGGGLIANSAAAANSARIPATCPPDPPTDPGYSGLVGSELKLVPFTPEHALLCRYAGMNGAGGSPAWSLAGEARLNGGKAAQLATSANAAAHPPPLGPVACPADDGSSSDVYFWNSSHRIRVRFLTSGCATASNGGVIHPSIAQSDIVRLLENLAPGHRPLP